ncbi:hypothetical protein ISF_01101 [Cordyceps fumosorosea ARSEF 2679]|uniref:Ubiquitin-like protein smt3 n=1 Tax=Cordyceps fumosorosea (strain ARSEF 2679) TaxID=1081104 RepID=A0A168ETH0_CORFA|nr:hypothetical protein ISF_01101 [Cordyceps fumosorosea ARSEF 2679]OAA74200.1 hypothetical protein ISF_01101 [Cordyceps fumosorosea ARSEF 2679]
MATNNDEVSSKLSSMSLKKDKPASKSKAKEVVDSWEDEDVSEPDESATPQATTASSPAAPPPTPATPSFASPPDGWGSGGGSPAAAADDDRQRPEKTDAVARRLIAAGLGLKAPKQTDEQRAYQKSVREQERRRRDQERAEQRQKAEASEKAKAAVWDD